MKIENKSDASSVDDDESDKPSVQEVGDAPRVEESSIISNFHVRFVIDSSNKCAEASNATPAPPASAPIVVEPTSNPIVAAALVTYTYILSYILPGKLNLK